ncbi:hypothetical protein [Nonomuraea sp. NPDC002799]
MTIDQLADELRNGLFDAGPPAQRPAEAPGEVVQAWDGGQP